MYACVVVSGQGNILYKKFSCVFFLLRLDVPPLLGVEHRRSREYSVTDAEPMGKDGSCVT